MKLRPRSSYEPHSIDLDPRRHHHRNLREPRPLLELFAPCKDHYTFPRYPTVLGEGAFGLVIKAESLQHGTVAIKRLDFSLLTEEDFQREKANLIAINTPGGNTHVVGYCDAFASDGAGCEYLSLYF